MQLKKLILLFFFTQVAAALFAKAHYVSDSTDVISLLQAAEQCIKAGNSGCQQTLTAAMQKAEKSASPYLRSLCYGMQSLSQRRYRTKQLIQLDQQALEEARKSGNDSLDLICTYQLAHDYGILGDIDNAERVVAQFSGQLGKTKNRYLKMRGLYEWGYFLYRKLDFDGARDKFIGALNLANSTNDLFWIAILKRSVFQNEVLGFYPEKQTAYLFDAIQYFNPIQNVETANSYAIAGRTFLITGNTAKAKEYYLAALAMYKRCNYPIEQGETWVNIAEVYLAEKNDRAGLAAINKAISFFRLHQSSPSLMQAFLMEARLYSLAGKDHLVDASFNRADSLLKTNPEKRLQYLYLASRLEHYRNNRKLDDVPKSMMDSLVKVQRELIPLDISMRMAERARQSGLLSVQEKEALREVLLGTRPDSVYANKQAEEKGFNPLTMNLPGYDSMYTALFNKQLTEMETRYRVKAVKDSLDKATTVTKLTQQKVLLKNWIIGLVSGLVVIAIGFLIVTNRQKNKAIADRNTIEVLQGELQHRATGALNTVIALLNIEKRKSADTTALIALESRITPLIGLFHSFRAQSADSQSLQDRFEELAAFYKGIFSADYEVEVIIQVPVKTEQRKMDKLILAMGELMLNSYKYAFEKGKKGVIRIDGVYESDHICRLIYSDNGNGLPEGGLKKKGGLATVSAVIETLDGTLRIENKHGFTAEIKFPV